ncbi:MAG: DNA alkylation repair protein [Oscillospiraceae bacterium]|nr:DNA alkylation repair protein [Oscillospiraceae bacterium]
MTASELRRELEKLAEPSLEPFQKRIVSDTRYPMLCVRVPNMRSLAKKAAREDWRWLVSQCEYTYYEEVLTAGLAAAYAGATLADRLSVLWEYLIPKLDSWAMTDTIVPTLKIKESERPLAWEFACRCIDAEPEYTRRFGIVMLMDYFLTEEFIPLVEEKISSIVDERYYVRMAAAWLLAEMGVSDFERVRRLLESGTLDLFTQNITIRKLRESYRITPEQKAAAAAFRRK